MKKELSIYSSYQYHVYWHYVATILKCNYAIITPKLDGLTIKGYNIKEAFTKHKPLSIDEFINNKSKQYSKGNIIDEWVWKYPKLKKD